jgi:hypothetical protein
MNNPATCFEISGEDEEADDGLYRLTRNGTTFQVYCDMTRAGGGWELVYKRSDSLDDQNPFFCGGLRGGFQPDGLLDPRIVDGVENCAPNSWLAGLTDAEMLCDFDEAPEGWTVRFDLAEEPPWDALTRANTDEAPYTGRLCWVSTPRAAEVESRMPDPMIIMDGLETLWCCEDPDEDGIGGGMGPKFCLNARFPNEEMVGEMEWHFFTNFDSNDGRCWIRGEFSPPGDP